MSKVYIVNSGGHDMGEAAAFGEFVILSEGKINVFSTDRIIADFKDKMRSMHPDDYLLFSGYAALNAFAFAIALNLCAKVNTLIFDFTLRKYTVRTQTREQFVCAPVKAEKIEEEVNYNK